MCPNYLKYSEIDSEITISRSDLIELYKDPSKEFASLNRLASIICDTPVSLVNMLDDNFQYTISGHGDWEPEIKPKQHTACQFTVENDEILVINDTLEDERASKIKELTEDASIRFYAGMPLKSEAGNRFGAFCVIDYEPKELNKQQKQALKDLAKEVEYRIRLTKQKNRLAFKNKKLDEAAAFLRNSADVLLVIEPKDFKIIKSTGANSVMGIEDEKLIGRSLLDHINQVNLKRHISNWIGNKYEDDKLGVPVQIVSDSEQNMWLNLTFSRYKGKLLVTGRNITKEHTAERELKKSLEEKEILLAEVHHRVKNNLAVVSSLIQLERMNSDNEEVNKVLLNSESRISGMAKIHELLYESRDFKNVNVEEYIKSLIDYLSDSHALNKRNIIIELLVGNINMNVNQCLPMGLIINEIITNAIKHAFENQNSGKISVQIAEKDQGEIECIIDDNGQGMEDENLDLDKEGGLGFTLISTLKKQLDAKLEINSNAGTTFTLTFQKNEKKGSVNNL